MIFLFGELPETKCICFVSMINGLEVMLIKNSYMAYWFLSKVDTSNWVCWNPFNTLQAYDI